MMNGVPREVQRPKDCVVQCSSMCSMKTVQCSAVHCVNLLCLKKTSNLDSLPASVAPRDYPGEYTPSAFTNIDSVKSNIVRGNYNSVQMFEPFRDQNPHIFEIISLR